MVEERKVFVCPLCNQGFSEKEDAEACEQSHQLPGKIIESLYWHGETYPRYMEVEFGNTTIRYSRG